MAPKTTSEIYMYIPNLIGYGRIFFAFLAFHYAYSNYIYFAVFYSTSQLLDAFDGMAARYFNQCSRLGAVLDMVTDRFSTCVLVAVLSHLYIDYYMVFFFLLVLDYVSHWAQMYSTLLTGQESHKGMNITNPFIKAYYTSKAVLFFTCVAQEAVYGGLYLMYFAAAGTPIYTFGYWTLVVCMPLCVFKQFINCLQLKMACDAINNWEKSGHKIEAAEAS